MAIKAIPDGYRTATPYLIVKGAADAIDYYKKTFGATELLRMADAQGRVGHAEIKIGDSVIMLADEHPAMGYRGPRLARRFECQHPAVSPGRRRGVRARGESGREGATAGGQPVLR